MDSNGKPPLVALVTWLAGLVAAIVTVALPLSYFVNSYQREGAILETESAINARLVGQIVAATPEQWRFRVARLEELLRHRSRDRVAEIRRIVALDGTMIARSADALDPPIHWHRAEILDDGVVVARFEIARSLRPMIYRTAAIALFGMTLGLVIFISLRALPLRALRRAFADNHQLIDSLEKQKADLLDANAASAQARQQLERQSEIALRHSEERFKAFMDRAPGIAFIKDDMGRYVYANKTWEDLYALDWRGKTDAELWPHDNAVMFTESDRRALAAGQAIEAFETVLDKTGRPQDWWVLKFPIVDGDGKRLLGGMGMDITEQTRRQAELAEAHLALTNAMPGISRLDLEGRYVAVNDAYASFLGYTPEQLLGRDSAMTIHPEDRATVHEAYRAMLRDGKGEAEARGVRQDGSVFFKQVLMVKRFDGQGKHIGHHCFMRDITDRKRADEALRQSEQRLSIAQSIAHLGSWEHDLSTGRSVWTKENYRLFGYEPGSVVPSHDLWVSRLHADDRSRVLEHMQGVLSGTKSFDIGYRIVHSNGAVRHIHALGEVLRDGGGVPLRMVGTCYDITERKSAEEALRQAYAELERRVEERTAELARTVAMLSKTEALLRQAVDVADLGVFERDHGSDELYYSPTMRKILDLPDDAPVRPGAFIDTVHPDDRETVRARRQLANDPAGDGQMSVEFRLLRRDGSIGWILNRAQTFFTGAGTARRAVRTVGAVLDITERKTTEQALRQLNQDLDRRVTLRTQELAEARTKLRALVAALTQAEERERRRLAVQLHDYLAQSLTAIAMVLGRAGQIVNGANGNGELKDILDNVRGDLANSLAYTRTLIGELSPRVLYDVGLPAALAWLGEQMGRHGLTVSVDGPSERLPLDEDDAVFLFQCARELLWNVVKHGATDRATVSYGQDGGLASLAVADQGKGFDPQAARANSNGGAHFGLFSIRERVELRGGRIDIDTASGIGTWVTIVLPVQQREDVSVPMAEPDMRQSGVGDAIKIVIVDDHIMVREGLRGLLEQQAGFAVAGEAGDGAAAIATVRDLQPDVVLMDINLPTLNGIDATREIVRDCPSTIVIGLSFGSDAYMVKAMQEAGAVTCIAKERALEDVRQAILDAVAQRRRGVIENGELRIEN